MMKLLLLIALIVLYIPSFSQSGKWKNKKKIEVITDYSRPFPLYGSIFAKSSQFDENFLGILGGSAGLIMENWLLIGGELEVFIPTSHKENRLMDTHTNIFGGSAGLRIEPVIWATEKYHLVLPYSVGLVFAGYYTKYDPASDQKSWFYGDRNIKHEPGIGLETNISPNLRISLNYSYRIVKIDLPDTPSNAFNGHNISLHFKIGGFHALYPYSRNRYVN